MTNDRWHQIGTLVDQALNLEDKRERSVFLQIQCGYDTELRREVESLIDSIEASEGLWDELLLSNRVLVADMTRGYETVSAAKSSEIPEKIGLYRIKKRLGHGGMGDVFLAKRTEGDFHRQVALKVIRQETGNREQARRFRLERTILSSLNHPGIARLLDGGISGDGRPYLVMEYVDGLPITDYCRKNNYNIEKRLDLFGQVCSAVQYAHSNFIVHRDLKPDNLLVTPEGRVKVLDFGIAKLLDQEVCEQTLLHTLAGQRMLSLNYAAPEQVNMEPVTTATDVYALGLLLYKLLTGTRALDLSNATLREAEQIIRHQEPPRPSSVVIDHGGTLWADLDAIVGKALRKEPEQRYESASRLWEDIERCQNNQPVMARKGTLKYRTLKFAKRNKIPLTFAVILSIVILGFSIFYAIRINQEKINAETEAQKANQIADYLASIFSQNYPEISKGEVITAKQLLESGVKKISTLDIHPEVEISMLNLFANIFQNTENLKKADSLAQIAIELNKNLNTPISEQLSLSYHVLALINRDIGNYDKSIEYFRKSLDQEKLTNTIADSNYAARLSAMAFVLRLNGELEEAVEANKEAIKIQKKLYGKSNIKLAESIFIQAAILKTLGQYEEALEFQLDSYEMVKELVEPPHPGLAANLGNLANLKYNTADYVQAEEYSRAAIEMYTNLFGENYSMVSSSLLKLGDALKAQGKFQDAMPYYNRALKLVVNNFGPNHLKTAPYYNNVGNYYLQIGDLSKADSMLNKSLRIKSEHLGSNHLENTYTYHNLALLEKKRGNIARAHSYAEKALEIRTEILGPNHPKTKRTAKLINDLKN